MRKLFFVVLAISIFGIPFALAENGLRVESGRGIRKGTGAGKSPISEPAPPSNFACRVEPSALSAAYSDLDPISPWTADSASTKGSECNVTQSTGTAKPTFRASCAEFGGEPCADCDGGDTLLASLAGFTSSLPLPYSICGIAMRSAHGLRGIFGSAKTGSFRYLTYTVTPSTMYYFDGTPSATVDNFTSLSNTTVGVGDSFCVSFDGSGNATLHINNVDTVVGSLPGHTAAFDGLSVGSHGQGSAFLIGRIAEIVVYDREIASEVPTWYAYTCDRYGLGC